MRVHFTVLITRASVKLTVVESDFGIPHNAAQPDFGIENH